MPKRPTPDTASIAHAASTGDKLVAPAATRNSDALCHLIDHFAPRAGDALEIASGTGQHIARFAPLRPNMIWQPTDIDADRLHSINAYTNETGAQNIRPACHLDATGTGWGAEHGNKSLIVLINLLHLISTTEMEILIGETADALSGNGVFALYGPFTRAGAFISEGDVTFHASLQSQDADIGYKDDFDVIDLAHTTGLELHAAVEMPANNLALIFHRPT